jgi:hypothetical protein
LQSEGLLGNPLGIFKPANVPSEQWTPLLTAAQVNEFHLERLRRDSVAANSYYAECLALLADSCDLTQVSASISVQI